MHILKSPYPGILFILLLLWIQPSFGQPTLKEVDKWHKLLSSKKNDPSNKAYHEVYEILKHSDSLTAFTYLDQLQSRYPDPNNYFKARISCIKAHVKIDFHQYSSTKELIAIAEQAIQEAYETDNDHLIAFTNFNCGAFMIRVNEFEHAATYLMKGQELYDRIGQTYAEQYETWVILGEVLFHCNEYEKSIYYTRKGIEIYDRTPNSSDHFRVRFYNTMGQNYEKLNNLDSALVYFNQSMNLAINIKDSVWQGINSGFLGQVYYKTGEPIKAKPLLEFNYAINEHHEYDHAAKSLQWLARIDMEQGRKDSALEKSKRALALISKVRSGYYLQPASFLQLVYQTTADVYRELGNTDSFYHYNQLSSTLHDSLQKIAVLSSLKISELRITNEDNIRSIHLMQKERQEEKARLVWLIILIVLVCTIVFLYFNRMRLKKRHQEQLALEQHKVAQAELHAAKEQMQLFTQHVVEKSELVEKLQGQLTYKEINPEHNNMLDEIRTLTILTEDDWETFKRLFDRMYPGFLSRLKEKARDITHAEQRMAALVKLELTSSQMAAMLGISIESVHKTRQRLRQRLHITNEVSLKEMVAEM